MDQKEILALIELSKKTETHPEFKDLLFAYPEFNTKPVFDTILQIPDLSLIEFEHLFGIKKYLESIHFLYSPKNPKSISKIEIEEIGHDLKDSDFEIFIDALDSTLNYIPSYLNIKISIKTGYFIKSGFDIETNSIFIKFNSNKKELMAEIGHEIGHIIESRSYNFYLLSQNFINARKISPKLYNYKDYCRENLLDLIDEPVPLFLGKFVDPYVGRIYENVNLTEVISVGIQFYILDPATFLIKDPEHFAMIEDILCQN